MSSAHGSYPPYTPLTLRTRPAHSVLGAASPERFLGILNQLVHAEISTAILRPNVFAEVYSQTSLDGATPREEAKLPQQVVTTRNT